MAGRLEGTDARQQGYLGAHQCLGVGGNSRSVSVAPMLRTTLACARRQAGRVRGPNSLALPLGPQFIGRRTSSGWLSKVHAQLTRQSCAGSWGLVLEKRETLTALEGGHTHPWGARELPGSGFPGAQALFSP